MNCLILTNGWEPLNRVSFKRAVNLYLKGVVQVVEWYDWVLRENILAPAVAVLKKTVTRKRSVKFSRENILLRDKFRCQYCGTRVTKSSLHLDHVVPRAKGGKTTWTNVVAACFDCNQKKRDRSPEQAGMRLHTEPVKPKTLPLVYSFTQLLKRDPQKIPEQWRSYLYWNVELIQD